MMEETRYGIHPKIGIARLGNSRRDFYIGPEAIGALPIRCSRLGDTDVVGGAEVTETRFKDPVGAVKRQAARFRIFRHDASGAREVVAGEDGITDITWTVHVANKKAIWFSFQELSGSLEFGPDNSYQAAGVPLNNPDVTDEAQRRALIIDPGPRMIAGAHQMQELSRATIPPGYAGSFPPADLSPAIESLGTLRTDAKGRLLVLGGYGTSTGRDAINSFRGASSWWDDISDGYVLATLTFADGSTRDLEPAWVLVGSPKYAPELVNFVTLDDTMYDIAVRFLGHDPLLYDATKHRGGVSDSSTYDPFAGFNPAFRPNYERDIRPIIERPRGYRWVAQIPSMEAFAQPAFDTRDASEANRAARQHYFGFYRVPVPPESYRFLRDGLVPNGPNTLFGPDNVPLMPLNSGDNSVTNTLIYKFMTLTPTQYFFMRQWAEGMFDTGPAPAGAEGDLLPLDHATIGNCVGAPFSPGIETSWIVRCPKLYARPFVIAAAHWAGSNAALRAHYAAQGLSLTADPQDGDGTEPGDLTKRMACPWPSDLYNCTVQTPNIVDPEINQHPLDNGQQVPPSFFVYWWPPQSPMHVLAGDLDPANQVLDAYVSNPPAIFTAPGPHGTGGSTVNVTMPNPSASPIVAAGAPVSFLRGVTSFAQMVASWPDLGFVVNQGAPDYPFFVERERGTTALAQGTTLGLK